jgi:Family of unknown function (DUF6343)
MADKRRGTVERPYSALNLRLVLALSGLVVLIAGTAVFAAAGYRPAALACGVLALAALGNVIVVQRRRVQRHRRSPGEHHSLFE